MQEESSLWENYLRVRDAASRNALVVHYLPIIEHVVRRFTPRDKEDLYQSGIFGLIKAIECFEPEREMDFRKFAHLKIRYAIIEALRNEGLASRHMYAKAKTYRNAVCKLRGKLSREPSDEEIGEELGVDSNSVAKSRTITAALFHSGNNADVEQIADRRSIQSPSDGDLEMLKILDPDERLVITLSIFNGMKHVVIGSEILGVRESRVSQIYNRGIRKLRDAYGVIEK